MIENRIRSGLVVLAIAAISLLPGCELVRGVFKAGVGIGVIVVLAVLGLAALAVGFVRRRTRGSGPAA